MSALFEQSVGILEHPTNLNRTLELRRDPFFRHNEEMYDPDPPNKNPMYSSNNPYMRPILEDTFATTDSDWMYTALLQAALDGPEPAWSKDDWSFVPFDLNQLSKPGVISGTRGTKFAPDSATNLTVHSPAIRARLDCSILEEARNSSRWLSYVPSKIHHLPSYDVIYEPDVKITGNNISTRLTAQGIDIQCCFNLTQLPSSDEGETTVTIAYWTENYDNNEQDRFPRNGNFTVKWIYGSAGFAEIALEKPSLFFPKPPKIQALNCAPRIETAQAEITVDARTGDVQGYRILESPVLEDAAAWSDEFQLRNCSKVPGDISSTEVLCHDVTTR
jgi:hypothetical protein